MTERRDIEPFRNDLKRGLVALLQTMDPIEIGLPGIEDPVPAPEPALAPPALSDR
jgi:hypothetical protein